MNRLHVAVALACVLLLGLFLSPTAVSAPSGNGSSTNARQARIVGVWNVALDAYRCDNGQYLTSFIGLHKFELGGTGQVVPATDPAMNSAHMMVWKHLGGNDYQSAIKFFRFENGSPVGWTVIENEVSINKAGTEYAGFGVASAYDLNGTLQMQSCPSITGTRFTGEE